MSAGPLSKQWNERRRSTSVDMVMRFTNEGLVLGAGTVLAPTVESPNDIRVDPSEPRLLALLAAAHLRMPTLGALNYIRRAAETWRQGKVALAAMHLALSGLDRLQRPEADAHRLFLADALLKNGVTASTIIAALESEASGDGRLAKLYNPAQPRVPSGNGIQSGRWTSGDFGSAEPQAEVNPSSVAPVVLPPVGSLNACREALSDCYYAALYASRNDPANDNSRFIDTGNCKKAGDSCEELSWVVEDLWGIKSAAVRFPHGGVVLIDKGQLDRYLPPLFGRPPPIRRYLGTGSDTFPNVAEGEVAEIDPYPCPPWRPAADEMISSNAVEFGACLDAVGAFASKTGGQIVDESFSFSKQWGKIVRAKVVTPERDSRPTACRVICWEDAEPGVNIYLELDIDDGR